MTTNLPSSRLGAGSRPLAARLIARAVLGGGKFLVPTTDANQEGRRVAIAMNTAAQIRPSPEARTLFGTMAVLAHPVDVQMLHLDLASTLAVGCRRARKGQQAGASKEVQDLLDEDWIRPAPDGGWLLG